MGDKINFLIGLKGSSLILLENNVDDHKPLQVTFIFSVDGLNLINIFNKSVKPLNSKIPQYQQLLKQYIDPQKFPLVFDFFYANARLQSYKVGETLFSQGELTDVIAVIISGEIELSYIDEQGSYVLVERFADGFWYGDGTFVDHQPMAYSAMVKAEIMCLVIDEEILASAQAPVDQFYRFICQNLMARLRIMYYKFDGITTLPLNLRIIDRLQQLQDKNGNVKITHNELAQYLSVSRYKVSRLLKQLEQQGKFKQHYGLIQMKLATD